MYGNGDVRAHEGADAAAGAFLGFPFIDLGRRITHAVDVGGGLEDFFGAEGDTEMAAFTPFAVNDDIV